MNKVFIVILLIGYVIMLTKLFIPIDQCIKTEKRKYMHYYITICKEKKQDAKIYRTKQKED